MNRQQLQASIAAYITAVLADTSWQCTAPQHAANIMRYLVDPYIVDSPVHRELAAVRHAADVQRDGMQSHIEVLQVQNEELRTRLDQRIEVPA